MKKTWESENKLNRVKEDLDNKDRYIYKDDNFDVYEWHEYGSTGYTINPTGKNKWGRYVLLLTNDADLTNWNIRITTDTNITPKYPKSFSMEVEFMQSILDSARKIAKLIGANIINE